VAKPTKDRDPDRAARIEALRKQSARAERRRTLVVVAICAVVAVAIVAATGWKLYSDNQRRDEVASTDLASIGPSSSAAGCSAVTTSPAEGSAQHLDGQDLDYPDAPPAFGAHWSTPADFARKFYTDSDRPEVERIVHNLEHGYTVLWYDETLADDDDAMQVVEDMANKFDVEVGEDIADYNANKFLAVPWTADDGEPFPDDAHVALTRWALEGPDAIPGQGLGAVQYCADASGEAVADFMEEYPASNALEPNGA